MSKSRIAWTDETWNPIIGCRKIARGCDHCYAIRDVHRMAGHPNPKISAANIDLTRYVNGQLNWTGAVRCLPDRLQQPLRWRKPRLVFVNSLSDLFHPEVPFDFVDQVFAVMALSPKHTFQVLTKRPIRMLDYFIRDFPARELAILKALAEFVGAKGKFSGQGRTAHFNDRERLLALPNVWLGVSASTQAEYETNMRYLIDCPAWIRWVSLEPLIERIDLRLEDCLSPNDHAETYERLHWVVVGGESGKNARPMDHSWAHHLKHQCSNFKVPFFMKQLSRANKPHGSLSDIEEFPPGLHIREYPAIART